MAYIVLADVKKVLKDTLYTYPADVDDEVAFAQSVIDSELVGIYSLPFDDTGTYSQVPGEIKWIASYLVAYKLWDSVVPLEGQSDDTAAERWRAMAMNWLKRIKEGDSKLSIAGVEVPRLSGSSLRFYPSGVKEKAASSDNTPYFTRAQAGEW